MGTEMRLISMMILRRVRRKGFLDRKDESGLEIHM
jgi:hypothetical protein